MLAFLTDHWWTIAIVINYILALLAVVTILFKSIINQELDSSIKSIK